MKLEIVRSLGAIMLGVSLSVALGADGVLSGFIVAGLFLLHCDLGDD